MTTTTFTLRWFTANCREAVVDMSKALPATRTTKRSPRPWSKTISTGTRESAQARIAVCGNCLLISARRSKALFSGRFALPIQKRALPRWRSSSTCFGVRLIFASCPWSASLRASSIVKPLKPRGASAWLGTAGPVTAGFSACATTCTVGAGWDDAPWEVSVFVIANAMPRAAPEAKVHPATTSEVLSMLMARTSKDGRLPPRARLVSMCG
mmetsp:Transcript_82937/g.213700  ORF Transcript_82937/g.213700 Transcript_82937/m.213700 type:complete len:211 (-) Transcript_82937:39-671(-)